MPVIPVTTVVDKKRIIGKREGPGGGEAKADPKKKENLLHQKPGFWIGNNSSDF
jgi:hypothetical protein